MSKAMLKVNVRSQCQKSMSKKSKPKVNVGVNVEVNGEVDVDAVFGPQHPLEAMTAGRGGQIRPVLGMIAGLHPACNTKILDR